MLIERTIRPAQLEDEPYVSVEEVSSLLVRLVRVKIGPLKLGLGIAAVIVLINVGIAGLRAYEDQLHFIQLAGGSAESTGDMPMSRIPPHL
ncbi:MAG: hypothetical protein IMZ62_17800 [Chloroflexi bacterium]|nr:hypothetical protein [Chloroflexota bacterium]